MLKIGILSCHAQAYSTRRLREACLERGHLVKVLHTLRFNLLIESGNPSLFFRNRKLSRYDAVIPRIGASVSAFGTAGSDSSSKWACSRSTRRRPSAVRGTSFAQRRS